MWGPGLDEGWGGLPPCSTALTCTQARAHAHRHTSSGGLLDVSAASQAAVCPPSPETLPHSPQKKELLQQHTQSQGPVTPVTEAVGGIREEKSPPESAGPLPPGWCRCSEARPTTPVEALHQCLHLLPKQGVFNQYFLLSSARVSNMARRSTELQKTKQKAKEKNPSAEGRAWLAAQRTFSRTTLSLVLQNTARSIGEPAVHTHGNSRGGGP